MTDQELLPTAQNIPDNRERKADRNRRSIEALMARLETEPEERREPRDVLDSRKASRLSKTMR